MQYPAIAIIGAGPAGLIAANILHQHGWPVTIFEADSLLTARDQGGTLDPHPESGQLALKKAGLLDAFMAKARHEDQEQRVYDYATGALLREDIPAPGEGERPEIDRVVLRQLLMEPLPEGMIHWGSRVEGLITLPDGRHQLRVNGALSAPYDLVIGADGAWSQVRKALTTVEPVYTGISFIELWLSDVDARHPQLAAMVGHGSMFSLHDGRGIFAQRNGGATLRVYAALRTAPEETNRPDKVLANISKDELLARFTGWSPSLLALIHDADRIAAVRPIMALPPEELRWRPQQGLTLVGDAAHVMPPLGVGVNLAMLDAAELATALVEQQNSGGNFRQAVAAYEAVMLERARAEAVEVIQQFTEWFTPEGGLSLLDTMQQLRENIEPAS